MNYEIISSIKKNIIDPNFEDWEDLIFNLINLYNTHEIDDDIRDLALRLLERYDDLGETAVLPRSVSR